MTTYYLRVDPANDVLVWETLFGGSSHTLVITDSTDVPYWKNATGAGAGESNFEIDDGTDVISWG